MVRQRTPAAVEGVLGQHINLAAAAHIARTQLVRNPRVRYDTEHLFEMLDVLARAIAKVAPLYIRGPEGAPRELSLAELQSATIVEGGNYLVFNDGRKLSNVTIRRADLRQAVAVLRAVGIPEFGDAPPLPPHAEPSPDPAQQFAELEALLRPPLITPQLERANAILIAMARHEKRGRGAANVAMQLMSALHKSRGAEQLDAAVPALLAQLRALMPEAEKTNP